MVERFACECLLNLGFLVCLGRRRSGYNSGWNGKLIHETIHSSWKTEGPVRSTKHKPRSRGLATRDATVAGAAPRFIFRGPLLTLAKTARGYMSRYVLVVAAESIIGDRPTFPERPHPCFWQSVGLNDQEA